MRVVPDQRCRFIVALSRMSCRLVLGIVLLHPVGAEQGPRREQPLISTVVVDAPSKAGWLGWARVLL